VQGCPCHLHTQLLLTSCVQIAQKIPLQALHIQHSFVCLQRQQDHKILYKLICGAAIRRSGILCCNTTLFCIDHIDSIFYLEMRHTNNHDKEIQRKQFSGAAYWTSSA
jgi:hypothetical protein